MSVSAGEEVSLSADFNAEIQRCVQQHFAESHQRVAVVYQRHFKNGRNVMARHWHNRRDIPADLLALPRLIWRTTTHWGKRRKAAAEPRMSGKEMALLEIINAELIRPVELQHKISAALMPVIPASRQQWQEIEVLLQHPMNPEQIAGIERFLKQKTQQLSGPREGGRDLLVFLLLGAIGNQLAGKVTFGSAFATGSALAGSFYMAQQSWWYGLWLSWSGVPGWVTWAGATGGLVAALALTPVMSPLAELVVNRVRGERFLHKLLDDIEAQSFQHQLDAIDAAGIAAGAAQIMPDLLALLKQLRI